MAFCLQQSVWFFMGIQTLGLGQSCNLDFLIKTSPFLSVHLICVTSSGHDRVMLGPSLWYLIFWWNVFILGPDRDFLTVPYMCDLKVAGWGNVYFRMKFTIFWWNLFHPGARVGLCSYDFLIMPVNVHCIYNLWPYSRSYIG